MNKGDKTPHGIYLGEVLIDRPESRLLQSDAEEHADAYIALGHEVYTDDPSSPHYVEGQREQVVAKLQDKAIGFLFAKEVSPVEVPEQVVDGVTIPAYIYTPEAEEIVILSEDLYRQLA